MRQRARGVHARAHLRQANRHADNVRHARVGSVDVLLHLHAFEQQRGPLWRHVVHVSFGDAQAERQHVAVWAVGGRGRAGRVRQSGACGPGREAALKTAPAWNAVARTTLEGPRFTAEEEQRDVRCEKVGELSGRQPRLGVLLRCVRQQPGALVKEAVQQRRAQRHVHLLLVAILGAGRHGTSEGGAGQSWAKDARAAMGAEARKKKERKRRKRGRGCDGGVG